MCVIELFKNVSHLIVKNEGTKLYKKTTLGKIISPLKNYFLKSRQLIIKTRVINPMKQKETIRNIVHHIVDKQLISNDPPETVVTYNRLLDQSFSDEEARLLISRLIHIELLKLMQNGEPFNKDRFIENLSKLPELPEVEINYTE